jgi:hypothetical protein
MKQRVRLGVPAYKESHPTLLYKNNWKSENTKVDLVLYLGFAIFPCAVNGQPWRVRHINLIYYLLNKETRDVRQANKYSQTL